MSGGESWCQRILELLAIISWSALATFAQEISTIETEVLVEKGRTHTNLEAYTACRLIPLDENPSVKPIGVSEVLWRIIGKAIPRLLPNGSQRLLRFTLRRPKSQTGSPNLKRIILRLNFGEQTTKFPAHSALLKRKRKAFGRPP